MTSAEFTALLELFGENINLLTNFMVGNLIFLIPFCIGLYFIHKKFKKFDKAKKLDPPDEIR